MKTSITRRPLLIAAIAATAVVTAGCGAVGHFDAMKQNAVHGKTLFVQKCGACHTLADAGTSGTIGPNLDEAFGPDKSQGFELSTIADVVRGQIAYPEENTGTGSPGMPANLYNGQDAKDVASYVGQCSANPSCKPTA